MSWQDIVITLAILIFSLSLFPQVYYGFKEKKGFITYATSAPTFTGLYVICIAYYTLGLYFSTALCFITGTIWLVLFMQRLKYGPASEKSFVG
ncbi:MAG: hypothetical protein ABH832_01965 [bacterium]